MDKRNKKSKGKCICWGLCICIVIALIIVAICAAVGVFSNQAAQPITARNFNTASVLGVGAPTNSSDVKMTPMPPISTIPNIPPSTETIAISIPRTLESQMRIDNFDFKPELSDKNSEDYKVMATKFEDEIMKILMSDESLKNANATFKVKVVDFSIGSIIVKYRISWDFNDEASNSQKDPIDPEMLKKKVSEMLSSNNEYIHEFHIPKSEVTSNKVLDICKIDNDDCEHDCIFDYDTLDFTCSCPEGQMLKKDGKHCEMHIHQEWEDHAEHVYHPNAEPKSEPEPSAEPTSKPEPEPKSEPEPTSEPEPKSEPEPSAEPEPTSEPESKSEQEPTSEPEPKSEPEPSAEPTAEPSAEPTAEPSAEPTPEPESKVEPLSSTTMRTHEEYILMGSTSLPEPEPTSEPEPEPKSEPEPTAEPKSEPEPTSEPAAEPEPTSEPEPKSELTVEPKPEQKSEPEPTSEPAAEPEPTSEPEPSAEPTSKPEKSAEPTAEPNAEPTTKPEPSAEPTPELTTKPEPSSDIIAELTTKPEPSAEPTPEPSAEPELNAEPTSKPEPEATPEPSAEPEPAAVTEKIESDKSEIKLETTMKELSEEPMTTTMKIDDKLHIYIPKAEIHHSPTTTEEPGTTIALEPAKETNQDMSTTTTTTTTTEKAVEEGRNQGLFIPVFVENPENQTTTLSVTTTTESTTINVNINNIPVVVKTDQQSIKTENHTENQLLEQTEHPNIVDMNPFLPYIDNDTSFINTLGSDDHFIGHHIIQNETESTENENDKPPRLDNDQINITNPHDPNPTDTTVLNVEPLDNEVKEDTTPSLEVQKEEMTTMQASKVESTTMPMIVKESEVTLSPDIINNIHSNKVFEQSILDSQTSTTSTTTSTTTEKESEISSSTEDLLALETTTNNLKTIMENITTPVLEGTTIHAEIIQTATEVINVVGSSTETQQSTEAAVKEYKVNESTDDITTTEKLFVSKATTVKPADVNQDLSVEPLTNLQEEDNFNQLDSNNDIEKTATTEESVTSSSSDLDNNLEDFNIKNKEMTITTEENEASTNIVSDVKPVTEDYTLTSFSRCTSEQFQCKNGTATKNGSYCISLKDRCDSVDDCTDGSDEVNCSEEDCPNNFKCKSGQCLKRHLICDGIRHCNDGSDEEQCSSWSCLKDDEFSCGEGERCIPKEWKCDGKSQCPNGVDEVNCNITCEEDFYHCKKDDKCIPLLWMCDGSADCSENEDEQGCECQPEEFQCVSVKGCLKMEQICNGVHECLDRSDEWDCLRLNTKEKSILEVQAKNNTWFPVCADNLNETYANMACEALGYAGASSFESIVKPDGLTPEGYYKLKTDLQYGAPMLSLLEKTDTCTNVAALNCQEFSCGTEQNLESQSPRIIGGNKATDSQWPSLALLYNKKENIQCTATVISPLWVSAAYSCVTSKNPGDWMLYAGSTSFLSGDNSTTQVKGVKDVVVNPQTKFHEFAFSNGIVLVRLTSALTLNRNVSAICLSEDEEYHQRQLCVISGWGVSKPGEPNKQHYLHYLPLPLMDTDECNSTKHYNGKLTKDQICAGYNKDDRTACYNDEGAPLMCFEDSSHAWRLQGILIHEDNCGKYGHPAVYINITKKLREWIVSTVGRQALTRWL